MNSVKLVVLLRRLGMSRARIAESLELTEPGLKKKLDEESSLRVRESLILARLLKMDAAQYLEVFLDETDQDSRRGAA